MERKTTLRHGVDASNGLKNLLLDPKITTDIAKAFDSVEMVCLQLQRDVAARKNDDEALQVIKGLGQLNDVLLLFRAEGLADIKAEQR
jgi:hypothetical protein